MQLSFLPIIFEVSFKIVKKNSLERLLIQFFIGYVFLQSDVFQYHPSTGVYCFDSLTSQHARFCGEALDERGHIRAPNKWLMQHEGWDVNVVFYLKK